MTNYERYFGTPELAAKNMVQHVSNRHIGVFHDCELVFGIKQVRNWRERYREWLESEADDGQ